MSSACTISDTFTLPVNPGISADKRHAWEQQTCTNKKCRISTIFLCTFTAEGQLLNRQLPLVVSLCRTCWVQWLYPELSSGLSAVIYHASPFVIEHAASVKLPDGRVNFSPPRFSTESGFDPWDKNTQRRGSCQNYLLFCEESNQSDRTIIL